MMASHHVPEDEVPSLNFTERTDFSIFLRYPDIDFDPESPQTNGPGPVIGFSSPASNADANLLPGRPGEPFSSPESDQHRNDDTDLASRSTSTPHTTPSPLGVQGRVSNQPEEYQEFMYKVVVADLPDTAKCFYRGLADQMLQVGAFLQPKTFYLSATTNQDILRYSDALLAQLVTSKKTVSGQISAIHYITSLAPFTVTPADLALSSIFNQRAILIVSHLSLPSRGSFSLLSSLLPVFDAYIYSPYLYLSRHRQNFSLTSASRINDLYNALQALITSYSQWLRTMGDLKYRYMLPLKQRIEDSPQVRMDIMEREAALLACEEMNMHPLSDIMTKEVEEEQLRGAERLAERRRAKSSTCAQERRRRGGGLQRRARTRTRREHTL